MRVFVTGASGHLGSAVIPKLVEQGNEVVGLARSDASATKVGDFGAEVLRASLTDLGELNAAAAQADAVVHLAMFDTDKLRSGDPAGAGAAGAAAVSVMGDALVGSGKPLLSVAAVGALGPLGHPPTEEDAAPAAGPAAAENLVLGFAQRGVAASIVRLPVVTHSLPNRPGLLGALIGAARQQGFVPVVNGGANQWPATHTSDVASIFPLALDAAAGTAGAHWHAIAEEGVAMHDIVSTLGDRLEVPVKEVTADELRPMLGFVADLAMQDLPATSFITRDVLGWTPTGPGVIDDLSAADLYQG